VALPTDSAAGNRIKSFALNNAGWIWLTELDSRANALDKAKVKFEEALGLYPNKVVHANLAEVARRSELYDDALEHFSQALQLDGEYVNARNEQACLKIEMAASAKPGKARNELLADAEIDHARAVQLAEDDRYATKLEATFRSTVEQHQDRLGRKADALLSR
jgi:tetratricopeptide (TPR) repeat protein